MQSVPLQLAEPWSGFYVQIESASQLFWQQAPFQDHGRIQNPAVWSLLQRKLQELLNELFADVPLTSLETFLLRSATHLYESGWQVAGAPEVTVPQRYILSGELIRDSFQRRENVPNLGLTELDPTTVGVLARLCASVGQEDLSNLSLAPEPGGYQETVRMRYLVAVFQIADALLVPRQKQAYLRGLTRFREEEESRLALHPYIALIAPKAGCLTTHIRVNPMDRNLATQMTDRVEEPIRRWWAANWRWLAGELQVKVILQTAPPNDEGIPPQPLHQTCKALIPYLSTYRPPALALPTLEQVQETCLGSKTNSATTSTIQIQGEMPTILEPAEHYVDFHLHINRYGHEIARSSEGEAHANNTLVISSNIDLALDLVTENTRSATLYKNLGRLLYELIFPEPIHIHFQKTEAVARNLRQKIRIRLDIEAETLARLPLELLYREDRGHFLAIDPHTALSRYLQVSYPRHRIRRRTGPLYMLTIISSPSDHAAVDVEQWRSIITESLSEQVKQRSLILDFATSGTFEEITRMLTGHKPDILQFVGHGLYVNQNGYLALMNEDGSSWLVNDASFANLLLGCMDNLGMVCLTGCESAKSDNPQSFLGLAPQLIQRGIPAVIAMQYNVKISTAELFFRHLYQNIAAQKPIDWAVQQARNAVSIKKGVDNREFVTPVLYMRAKDGDIF